MAKRNPELLILNPDEIREEAEDTVQENEDEFAELFDKMKAEISAKVGYDITEDPESEEFVDSLLVELMQGIKIKEVEKK